MPFYPNMYKIYISADLVWLNLLNMLYKILHIYNLDERKKLFPANNENIGHINFSKVLRFAQKNSYRNITQYAIFRHIIVISYHLYT